MDQFSDHTEIFESYWNFWIIFNFFDYFEFFPRESRSKTMHPKISFILIIRVLIINTYDFPTLLYCAWERWKVYQGIPNKLTNKSKEFSDV